MNTRLALRISVAAVVGALVALGLAIAAWRSAAHRVVAAPPRVVVTLRYEHASASSVESEVTTVLEDALAASASVGHVTSTSRDGEAEIVVEAARSVDLDALAADTTHTLAATSALLPSDVGMPTLVRADAPLARCVLTGSDLLSLGELAAWQVRPALESIPGVSRVLVHGAPERRVVVTVDLERAAARGETPLTIAEAISRSLDAGPQGAWIAAGDRAVAVGGTTDRTLDELGQRTIAMRDGAITRLADVASVSEDGTAPEAPARADGEPAVVLEIRGSAGIDAVQMQRMLRERVAQLSLPPQVRTRVLADTAPRALGARDEAAPLVVRLAWPIGTTIERALAASLEAERAVMRVDGVAAVIAESAPDGRPHVVTWRVIPSLDDAALAQRVHDAAVLSSPGAIVTVLDARHAQAPAIEIDVSGDTAATLATTAAEIAGRIASIAGLGDVRVVPATPASTLELTLDHARIERYGLDVERVAHELRIGVEGEEVGALQQADRMTPIWVHASVRDTAALLTALRIPTQQGLVPLAELGTLASGTDAGEILHVDRRRAFAVRASHDARDRDEVLADIAAALRDVRLPPGVTVTTGTEL